MLDQLRDMVGMWMACGEVVGGGSIRPYLTSENVTDANSCEKQ